MPESCVVFRTPKKLVFWLELWSWSGQWGLVVGQTQWRLSLSHAGDSEAAHLASGEASSVSVNSEVACWGNQITTHTVKKLTVWTQKASVVNTVSLFILSLPYLCFPQEEELVKNGFIKMTYLNLLLSIH